jgi:hypothetical protein
MTLKRKLRWLGAAVAALTLCAAVAWFPWPAVPPISVETYERVRPGMTRQEVEELLGGPGGMREDLVRWVDNRSPAFGPGSDLINGKRGVPGIRYWYQDSGIIIVEFDADNRVADKQFLWVLGQPPAKGFTGSWNESAGEAPNLSWRLESTGVPRTGKSSSWSAPRGAPNPGLHLTGGASSVSAISSPPDAPPGPAWLFFDSRASARADLFRTRAGRHCAPLVRYGKRRQP